MRQQGYNAVSYRDIAAEMGITSASLHYHFAKKSDMGVALVRRYSENFSAQLRSITQTETDGETGGEITDPGAMIAAFVDLYRYALTQQRLVCLCAVLGAEAPGLPPAIAAEVKAFFQINIAWLTARYERLGEAKPAQRAKITLALLEGAMIISSVNADMSIFEAAARSVQSVQVQSVPVKTIST